VVFWKAGENCEIVSKLWFSGRRVKIVSQNFLCWIIVNLTRCLRHHRYSCVALTGFLAKGREQRVSQPS